MKILILILLLITNSVYSQISSGKIRYSTRFNVKVILQDTKPNPHLKSMYENVEAEVERSNSFLIFNQDSSEFKTEPNLPLDKNKAAHSLAQGIISSGIHFVKKDEYINLRKVSGKTFRIKEIQSIDWEITRDVGMIKGYKVYRAYGNKYFINAVSGNARQIKIEAWFAPAINFSYGPKGYHGLPGLILQLEDGPITFFAEDINLFQKDNLNIKWPSEGVLISKEDYDRIIGENLKNMF
ncbi:MAG: GLPGLI family protein [Gillisia sp.]